MTLTYRAAVPTDAPEIDRIRCAAGAEVTERLGPGHWSILSNVARVRRSIRTRSIYLAFNEAGEAVATFTVGTNAPGFWPRSRWREPHEPALGVFDLAVQPEFQRRGIGTWVMRTIEDLAREQGLRYVRLDAYEQNPRSIAFYRKLGYDERSRVTIRGVPLICFEQEVVTAPEEGGTRN